MKEITIHDVIDDTVSMRAYRSMSFEMSEYKNSMQIMSDETLCQIGRNFIK